MGRPVHVTVGDKYNRLTALTDSYSKDNRLVAEWECECKNKVVVQCCAVVRGRTKSCGCLSREKASQRMKQMAPRGTPVVKGERYGLWEVIGDQYYEKVNGKPIGFVWCRCECTKEKLVRVANLKKGISKSCGCLKARLTSERCKTHGMTGTKMYIAWAGMTQRCNNPNADPGERYFHRGITTPKEWESFEAFRDWSYANGWVEDDPDISLDRIDYDGPYTPENCRWTDLKTQANNRSNNHRVTYQGETKTLAEWSRDPRCLVSYDVLQTRVSALEWPFEQAMTIPARDKGGRSPEHVRAMKRAHWAVKTALQSGRLTKPDVCQWPGCEHRGRIEAHHYRGYAQEDWLRVHFLCPRHHGWSGLGIPAPGTTYDEMCLDHRPYKPRSHPKTHDVEIGQTFNRLTVISEPGPHPTKVRTGRHVRCRCVCDNETVVSVSALVLGRTKSCGCLLVESTRERAIAMAKARPRENPRLRSLYRQMKYRCLNSDHPDYERYGGRGVTICEEWLAGYEPFRDWAMANGYVDDLYLIRRDRLGNFSPGNCWWGNRGERERSRADAVELTAFGETKTVAAWVRDPRCVVSYGCLRDRLQLLGWEVEDALTKPIRPITGVHC
jgi:hypothetical protein